jgi:type III secretion protein D
MHNSELGEIVLLSGEQAGARARLSSNASISISGDLGTDIVIRDEYINDEQLKLITKEEKVFLQIVSGKVEVDGQQVEKNNTIHLKEDAKVKVGNTIFVHQKSLNVPLSEIEKKCNTSNNECNSSVDKNTNYISKKSMYFSVPVVVVLIGILILSTNINSNNKRDHTASEEQQTRNLLKKNGYGDLQVAKSQDDQIVVSGFVLTNRDRANIEKVIDENSIPVAYDLEVGDQLAKEVIELYRVNGVDIQASALGHGVVVVKAYDKDMEAATQLQEIALNEVKSLKKLDIEYKDSEEVPHTIGDDISYNEKDKRITMVVDGDPAYIMTSDHAKYYVGALLPEGYKVVDIIDKQVILERHGKMTTLNF